MRSLYGVLDAEIILSRKKIAYQKASLFKRFLNLVIDYMSILNLSIFVGVFIGVIFVLVGKEEWVTLLSINAVSLTLGWIVIFLYYFFCEYYLGGKTLGKFATKTKVTTTSGDEPNMKDIFYRSILRLIPLEPFSIFLGKKQGWHDKFSRTIVIEDF